MNHAGSAGISPRTVAAFAQHVVLRAEGHAIDVVVSPLRGNVDVAGTLRAPEARGVPVLIQCCDTIVVPDAEITSRTGYHGGGRLNESLAVMIRAVQASLM